MFKRRKSVLHETFDQQGHRFFFVKTTAHQVVKLVTVNRCTRCTMGGRNFISEHFQFGNGFRSSFFGQEEIFEHLTRIAMVGVFSDG